MIYTLTLNPAVDLELAVADFQFDTVTRAVKSRMDCGGKGFNVSRMLANLKTPSIAMGLVGGKSGERLEQVLRSLGIETDFNWIKGETQPEVVSLEAIVDNIARISDLAGSTDHVGIGSDLDGGYGTEQTPHDLDTIADLQKIAGLMRDRGFSEEDVVKVMHGNWMRFFREHLP